MTVLKDRIGREVKVGDILASSGTGSGVDITVVIKLNAKTVRVMPGHDLVHTDYAVIINEQMESTPNGIKLKEKLLDQYKDRFDYTPPKR